MLHDAGKCLTARVQGSDDAVLLGQARHLQRPRGHAPGHPEHRLAGLVQRGRELFLGLRRRQPFKHRPTKACDHADRLRQPAARLRIVVAAGEADQAGHVGVRQQRHVDVRLVGQGEPQQDLLPGLEHLHARQQLQHQLLLATCLVPGIQLHRDLDERQHALGQDLPGNANLLPDELADAVPARSLDARPRLGPDGAQLQRLCQHLLQFGHLRHHAHPILLRPEALVNPHKGSNLLDLPHVL
mmetsp:Transcript_21965/g.55988  ORF Transcript_21965/g.55988 Transcript_21965/m.55988 type:complete len:242 (-) Transcript_21965:12-737(-)